MVYNRRVANVVDRLRTGTHLCTADPARNVPTAGTLTLRELGLAVASATDARMSRRSDNPSKAALRSRAFRAAHPGYYATSVTREAAKARQRRYREDPAYLAKQVEMERERRYQREYGISTREYEVMLEAQAGGCALCGGVARDGRRLAVDHDHATGQARALLCNTCNTGIGMFADDVTLLRRAVAYLESH